MLFAMMIIFGFGTASVMAQQTTTTTYTNPATGQTTTTVVQHATTTSIPPSNIPLCEIIRGLSVGSTGEDVRCLQRYLNWAGFTVALTGAGSVGLESPYFGALTRAAVIRWQNANSAFVLAPLGLSAGTGFWGNGSQLRYSGIVRTALGVN